MAVSLIPESPDFSHGEYVNLQIFSHGRVINLKDYGIPNDSLDQRMEIFLQLMTPDPKTKYMDGEVYQLMRPYVKSKNMSTRDKLWLGILYSMSYSCSTAIRFFEEFPEINNWNKVEDYWNEEKSTLHFNPDRKYLKNNNQVVNVLKRIYQLSNGGEMDKYFIPFLNQGFDAAYTEIIKNWYGYGPMGAYLFFDTVYGFSPELYSDPKHLDWKGSGQTVVEGMANLLGDDDAIDTKQYDIPKFNEIVEYLVKTLKCPKIVIESNLCFFRKLFKASRYLGYYADRELEEYRKVDKILLKYGVDIWKLREQTCQNELRGEIHGWLGIQKFMMHDYLKTGKLRCSLDITQ